MRTPQSCWVSRLLEIALFHWHDIFAVEGRRVDCESNGRLAGGIDEVVHGAARYIDDISGGQFDASFFQNQITLSFQHRDRSIVQFMQMRHLTVTNLHDVMANSGSLTERYCFDVFACAERIFRDYFFQLPLASTHYRTGERSVAPEHMLAATTKKPSRAL